ncbi:chromosome segregation protein SMC [Erysipelothrix sp. HDW6A]|uniref:chromosome segregation protein SMC n=1 Tax=Erysipelothrix sp. HDW6A TaxID=2714928 RepID=UPI00140AD459|nr:chromosome segregation protein SMC [Erysipelothrix sp. HDW6A]QIK57469.1 chromosome segregation protein SMC [Erysipelothrix sp. HDW6A]
MFLKKIEMQGFKSFADKVIIHFDDPVTGVVGPNGCGKSNISDAIRWVLGEQSVKSMRGSSMTDVIFNGSENRRKVNLAEVTLVFDNEERALNSDYEEVEVTRRLYRDTRESEYLINKTPCRLRDIHDLVMDTGLGRDSLSIISQGTISHFAEAKPIDRRLIFEEAAGVSKYKKRKIESINKLERTRENMERMQDIVDEIERQVNSLKRAAKKALLYKDKKSMLEAVEVSVLVRDIKDLTEANEETQSQLFKMDAEIASLETSEGVYDNELESMKKELNDMDHAVSKAQETMMSFIREIGVLESRKIEIEERRKYTLEVGDKKAKQQEMLALLNDARLEYEDRKSRHESLNAEVELLVEESYERNRKMADQAQSIANLRGKIQQLSSRLDIVSSRLERPYESNHGVQAIMDNKQSLFGVHDTVSNVFEVSEGYETAITTALAGALMHLVVDDDKAAVNAINFLKNNRAGRATFIPLTVSKPRYVNQDALLVANHAKGYLGVASEFASNGEVYNDLRDSLLGNVMVVDTIENANVLAKRVQHNYKIVTLDGDVIHRGGIMSGGRNRQNNTSSLTLKRDKEQLENELRIAKDSLILEENQNHSLSTEHKDAGDILMQRRIALAQLEPLLEVKRSKYERLKQEYEDLNPDQEIEDAEKTEDDVVVQLNSLYMQRDELTTNIALMRERRQGLNQEIQRKEILIRQYRQDLNKLTQKRHECALEVTKNNTRLESSLERLSSEYRMTYDYALENVYDESAEMSREEVMKLRNEINALGNVNLEAPEEYEETNERFQFYGKQLADLKESRDKLLSIIEEMDDIMVTQFKDMFDRINHELPEVFSALFGGGRARLVLEDENDLLNTGIDIDVQPPGKSVQNIRLFSGGEKSLIAISVLFAILKARHVPLCIFDEVEAALDTANVERFANYIRNFSNDTQFIVITHRPGTMAQADVLYGVTMPTKGVSSMLKVRLEDAVEMKERDA